MPYGTLTVHDLRNTQDVLGNLKVIELGEDRIYEAFAAELAVHNQQLQEELDDFAEPTTERFLRYGGTQQMKMMPVDELGTVDAQKVAAGANLYLPLRAFQVTLQWTRLWFEEHTAREMAAQLVAIEDADARQVQADLQRALFNPTNYTFTDRRRDEATLAVKALVNADSAPIPMGPSGQVFDPATHTHYLTKAGGAFANTDLDSLIGTVREHYGSGEMMVYINSGQEAAVRAFTGFSPLVDARIVQASTATYAQGSLDTVNINNRRIGIYNGAEVWVKPWIPVGYVLAWMRGAPKPLLQRQPVNKRTGLYLIYEFDQYPLHARSAMHEYGFGVHNRTNGAIMDIVNGSYTAPVFSN